MALFDDVFSKSSIYDMLFFNVKAVLINPTLDELKANNPKMYERWKYISKAKLREDFDIFISVGNEAHLQKSYEENAVQYPEFVRIVAISYATLYTENGEVKRHLKKITGEDEPMVIEQFMTLLAEISSNDSMSSPKKYSILCGHNIIAYDIPLLIKRFIINKGKFQHYKEIPFLLKRALSIKPWESGIIDTVNVWKFNGFDYSPLMLIADTLNLKKTVDIETHSELSKYYWALIKTEPQKALEFVSLQSATQTNVVVQLMNELRHF